MHEKFLIFIASIPSAALLAVACHESPQAAVAQVVDLTDAVCSLAPDSPVGAPVVELVCQVLEGVEGDVSVVVGATADGGVLAARATIKADHVYKEYRFPLPAAAVPAFLAAHRGPDAGK